MSTGYNLGHNKNFPAMTRICLLRQRLVLQSEKWVATVFEGGRNTASVPIYFSLKNFVSTGKTGSRHHISVSSIMTELLMSQPNFLINCLNQSIPCCDNLFSSLIKQCRDIEFFFFSTKNLFPQIAAT